MKNIFFIVALLISGTFAHGSVKNQDDRFKNLDLLNKTELVPILISIQDEIELNNIFREHKPDVVFYAAAYKHVPLIEENIFEGIKNNIFSTLSILKIFDQYNGKKFVLVSTDKAVRPKNIMGATKRVAELIVQAYANKNNYDKNFSIVRFGNVLNSSGSVVPLFRKQINNGGPLTITHPEITRYFMTILIQNLKLLTLKKLKKSLKIKRLKK